MLGCGTNKAYIYARGGEELIAEVVGITSLTYSRRRDDISEADVTVASDICCSVLSKVASVIQELHIYRDGIRVWRGVIVRVEWGRDESRIFAADMLWVASRKVLESGLDLRYPRIEYAGSVALRILEEAYAAHGNQWNMAGKVKWIISPTSGSTDEARTSRVVNPYSSTVWSEVDKLADDGGIDYTVVNDTIYVWDTNLAWKVNSLISPEDLGGWPDVVEYGNELFTKVFTTNNSGVARYAENTYWQTVYGIIEEVVNSKTEADGEATQEPEELQVLLEQSEHILSDSVPAPVRVRIPANVQLMPSLAWDFSELIPGAWFPIEVLDLCRNVTDWHKIDDIVVTESPDRGEVITMTSSAAPNNRVDL